MFKIYSPSNLIGYKETGIQEFSQYGSDSLKTYQQNSKDQAADWFYQTTKVFYDRNDNGHRSKNIHHLNNDFILFAGCSITEGIGVRVEDSFAHLMSSHLGLDYYNLALNGGGPDLVAHNIGSWFQNVKLKPKMVIIQWPSKHRVCYREHNDAIFPLGPWSCKPTDGNVISEHAWKAYESMIDTDFFDHYTDIFKSSIVSLLEIANIKVITFETDDIEILDYARDLKHPGIESHKKIKDKLLSIL